MPYSNYPLEGVRATYVLDANGVVQGLRAPNTQDSQGADVPGALIPTGNAIPFLTIDGTSTLPSYAFAVTPGDGMYHVNPGAVGISAGGTEAMRFLAAGVAIGTGGTTILSQDAADILAQRRGVNAQTFRLYNTFTDASNYERVSLNWSGIANSGLLATEALGTGTLRDLYLRGQRLLFQTGGNSNRWMIDAAGHFQALSDNAYDLGLFGSARPRNLYIGSALFLTSPTAQAAGAYTVLATDTTVINSVASTLTLPAVGTSTGRKVRVVTTGVNAIISNASNVVPITGGAAGTAILAATAGKWADLECNGTNWIITAAN